MKSIWQGVGSGPGFIILFGLTHVGDDYWRGAAIAFAVLLIQMGQTIGGALYDRIRSVT
jgi:hypothetical protein